MLCERCRQEIEHANLLDRFPEIDRDHCTVAGQYLPARLWELFCYLLARGMAAADGEIKDAVGKEFSSQSIREMAYELNLVLKPTRFRVARPRPQYRQMLIEPGAIA